jgi:hypothetical protein
VTLSDFSRPVSSILLLRHSWTMTLVAARRVWVVVGSLSYVVKA